MIHFCPLQHDDDARKYLEASGGGILSRARDANLPGSCRTARQSGRVEPRRRKRFCLQCPIPGHLRLTVHELLIFIRARSQVSHQQQYWGIVRNRECLRFEMRSASLSLSADLVSGYSGNATVLHSRDPRFESRVIYLISSVRFPTVRPISYCTESRDLILLYTTIMIISCHMFPKLIMRRHSLTGFCFNGSLVK
jgi:hypothetical protein